MTGGNYNLKKLDLRIYLFHVDGNQANFLKEKKKKEISLQFKRQKKIFSFIQYDSIISRCFKVTSSKKSNVKLCSDTSDRRFEKLDRKKHEINAITVTCQSRFNLSIKIDDPTWWQNVNALYRFKFTI